MFFSLKQLIGKATPKDVREEREREIMDAKFEIRNSLQAIQSGNRVLSTMSAMIELQRSKPS